VVAAHRLELAASRFKSSAWARRNSAGGWRGSVIERGCEKRTGRPATRQPAKFDCCPNKNSAPPFYNAVRESLIDREKQMKNFILFVAILCGGTSVLLFTVGKEALRGPSWAGQMCKAAGSLCHNPQLLAFAAAGLAALWLVILFVSAIRD
jgi:hypothetical protein